MAIQLEQARSELAQFSQEELSQVDGIISRAITVVVTLTVYTTATLLWQLPKPTLDAPSNPTSTRKGWFVISLILIAAILFSAYLFAGYYVLFALPVLGMCVLIVFRRHVVRRELIYALGLGLIVGIAGFAAALLLAAAPATAQTILNVSYDPTREFYQEYNAAFAKHWLASTGKEVTVRQSHGGSGKQARAVIDGSRRTCSRWRCPTTSTPWPGSRASCRRPGRSACPTTARPKPRPSSSWSAKGIPRESRTGTTWSGPACRW